MLLPQIPADGKERRFLFEAVIIDIFYRFYSKAIPHKDSAADALSDFSSDCTEIPKAY